MGGKWDGEKKRRELVGGVVEGGVEGGCVG